VQVMLALRFEVLICNFSTPIAFLEYFNLSRRQIVLLHITAPHNMPLDPVTAFGLAGNVIQFIDFGCNLLSESLDLYHSASGSTAENVELEIVAKDIKDSIAPLLVSAESSSVTLTYQKLLRSCDDIAKELLSVVDKLKVKDGPHRKWRSFGKALRSIWKKDEVSKLRSRLSELRDQIVTHVIADSRDIIRYLNPIYVLVWQRLTFGAATK
jgi:hypothetical protein